MSSWRLECEEWVADLTVPPYEQSTDWSEQNANDEEGRKDGFGSKNGLPCLQTLLLEGSICKPVRNPG